MDAVAVLPAEGPPPPVVEFLEVARSFPGTPTVHALRACSLSINTGEYVSIVGPSGSGKSTMLNLLGLLDQPTSGDYLLDGVNTSTLNEDERAHLRGSSIGFVFQSFHLLPGRTVLDNVILGTMYSGLPRGEREARALEALERVNLTHRLMFLPGNLSGGERQRVAVARAVVTSPRILLADEPTGNLDAANSNDVMELFSELHASGLTLIVITHDLAVAARSERSIRLVNGVLQQDAS